MRIFGRHQKIAFFAAYHARSRSVNAPIPERGPGAWRSDVRDRSSAPSTVTLRVSVGRLGDEVAMLAELWCDQRTRDKLGEAGLAEVTAGLWAQDCQTCGHALGGEPPALCVDKLTGYATAGLHHRRCRPPGWNDGSLADYLAKLGTSHPVSTQE
jgi:hypothetical protein